ncbi:MAG: T9SS type A sorting domain-containing protein [Bacteroidota bacterium]
METWKLRQAALAASGPLLLTQPAAPSYDVVALRVEFQPDTTRFTTGVGTFDGELYEGGLEPNVDPLPHNAGYFEAHLAFLENYVQRVSNGRTTVTTHLVPEVVQVSQPMGAYSPTGFEAQSDAELAKLAALVEEAWTLASAQSAFDVRSFDPERTAFVLFHAGVGRDLELIGTTLDKTPQDLPSIFFNDDSLVRLLDDSALSFKGLPVSNTIVMPRTETRRGVNFITDEAFLAEFSINVLLAASFFNYLGVPDLFDTETGQSAIGPFGLMDPFGLFAFSGLFPPEPMAWTRAYLGWSDVLVLDSDTDRPTLPAVAGGAPMDMAQARIAEGEYFLIENRQRDVEGDGLVMQIWRDGQVSEQRIELGDEMFDQFSIEGFAGGVVIDVDNYDWALPGALDEDDVVRNGGMLIWHIDEARIRNGLPTNSVNVDAARGIDLEEADSAEDLGTSSAGTLGPQLEFGTPFDYFYEGNPVLAVTGFGNEIQLYENRFGADTFPNSDTNAGTPSYIELRDFSASGPEMSFTYAIVPAGGITPLDMSECPANVAPRRAAGAVRADRHSTLYVSDPSCETTVAYYLDTASNRYELFVHEPSRELLAQAAFPATPAIVVEPGQVPRVTWYDDEAILSQQLDGVSGIRERPFGTAFEGRRPTSDVVYAAAQGLDTYYLSFEGEPSVLLAQVDALPLSVDGIGEVLTVAARENAVYALGTTGVQALPNDGFKLDVVSQPGEVGHPVLGRRGVLPLPASRQLAIVQAPDVQHVNLAPYCAENTTLNPDVLVADGVPIVTSCGATVVGITWSGAIADNFPVALPANVSTGFTALQATDGGTTSVFLFGTADGLVYAMDANGGEVLPGFPLKAGIEVLQTPRVSDGVLYAMSVAGSLSAWRIEDPRFVRSLNDAFGNRVVGAADVPETPGTASNLALDREETYNWPNPITEGVTHIRVQADPNQPVDVQIVDMAGALVDSFTLPPGTVAGPREHRWQTDAPSGVYFARVKVRGTGEAHIIKMAIVR